METLSYLHITVTNEEPTDTNYTLRDAWKNPNVLTVLSSPQFSARAAVPLISLTVVLGILGMARQAFALAKPGDRSAEVTALQLRLQKLGYFKNKATGYYGPLTRQAVMRYQQARGLAADGIIGPNTQASLSGYQEQAREELVHPTWELGDRDAKVSEIQKTLAQAGYPSSINGVFDRETAEAVRLFQQAKGLKVDGIVGKETLAALSENPKSENLENPSTPEFAPEPKKTIRWESIEEPDTSAVEETTKSIWQIGDRDTKVGGIQQQLAAAGFPGGANGVFDIQTEKAVRQFQQAKGLKVDGIVGEETLAALSETPKASSQPNSSTPEPKPTTPWYEDNSAPLAPFTR
ncbi:MAG: hypothetical protein Fur006_54980 [Coleofasciculaceae cyanobacterium]